MKKGKKPSYPPRPEPTPRGQRIAKQIFDELVEYFAEDETIEVDDESLPYEVVKAGTSMVFHLKIKDPELFVRNRHITIEVRESF